MRYNYNNRRRTSGSNKRTIRIHFCGRFIYKQVIFQRKTKYPNQNLVRHFYNKRKFDKAVISLVTQLIRHMHLNLQQVKITS